MTERLADGEVIDIETDFVFMATGELPNSAHAQEVLGIEVGFTGRVIVDKMMRTSVPNVYAIGDMIDGPMEMFKARKCGVTAARNIMGEPIEFDFTEYPDFLHTTYEVTWVEGLDSENLPLPCSDRSMIYAFSRPELSGFQKLVALEQPAVVIQTSVASEDIVSHGASHVRVVADRHRQGCHDPG